MRLDKEDSVQVAAINLCGRLLTLDMLEPEECIEICEMVFMDTKKTVSQAAGLWTQNDDGGCYWLVNSRYRSVVKSLIDGECVCGLVSFFATNKNRYCIVLKEEKQM